MKEDNYKGLPKPNKKSIFFSNLLKKKILNKIKNSAKDSISFFDYLNLVLYDKKYGYYNNNLKKFGVAGDFVTAPEISNLFGKCLAHHFSKILNKKLVILEIGAGTGKLAIDIIEELLELGVKIEKYYILELSSNLRNKQIKNIYNYSNKIYKKVKWILDFPSEFEGIVVANELLDALPFNLIQFENNNLYEMFVKYKNDKLYLDRDLLTNKTVKNAIKKEVPNRIINYKGTYQSEINILYEPLLNSIQLCLKKGYIFLIDYGFLKNEFFHEQRRMGTYMCHYRHFKHDNVFVFPGLQDITSHVNFTHVKNIVKNKGLKVSGFGNQSDFLISSGLNKIYLKESKKRKNIHQINREVFLLTSPNEMGSLFKVIEVKK